MKNRILFAISIILLLSPILNAKTSDANNVLKNKLDLYLTKNVTNGLSGAVLVAKEGTIILNEVWNGQ